MLHRINKNVNIKYATNILCCGCIYGSIYLVHVVQIIHKGVKRISKIAEVRRAHEMTQAQLAKVSGVHRVTIARYESGATSPTIRSLEKLAEAMGVPVSDLIDRKGA